MSYGSAFGLPYRNVDEHVEENMAFAITKETATLLLAYCVTGVSLWTINNRMTESSGVVHAPMPFEDFVKPIVSLPVRVQMQSWQATDIETSSSDDALGKGEELRQMRRRAAMAAVLITALKNSATRVN